jgi:hypothetical protein
VPALFAYLGVGERRHGVPFRRARYAQPVLAGRAEPLVALVALVAIERVEFGEVASRGKIITRKHGSPLRELFGNDRRAALVLDVEYLGHHELSVRIEELVGALHRTVQRADEVGAVFGRPRHSQVRVRFLQG